MITQLDEPVYQLRSMMNHMQYTLHLNEIVDELHIVVEELDLLAAVWGDEGVFRRCRDRLRKLIADANENRIR